MSQASKVALFLAIFFAGCAAEHLVVPPARAGAPASRWEYVCKDENHAEAMSSMANEFGAQGWELVGGAGAPYPIWCFKRALP